MKRQQKLLMMVLFLLTNGLVGCNTIPERPEIEEIPPGAVKVMTMDLTARSGTYTLGDLDLFGNGYIIFEVDLHSGTLTSLGVYDVTADQTICEVRRPRTALYSSECYEYKLGTEYELSLVNAKNITGGVNLYFVDQ